MKSSLLSQIEGTWLLVSMTYEDKDSNIIDLYGRNPFGILMYDKWGYMNAQMGYNTRKLFASDSLAEGSPEEIKSAYTSFMAYFGKYHEASPGVIIHKVIGCMFPNWQEKEEIRYAAIQDGLLIISTPPILFKDSDIVIKAVWRRP